MQDFTGVPAVVDLAAMRSAMQRLGGDPRKINPLVPVDLVIETVEAVWDRIAEDDDWSVLDVLIADIRETGEAYGLGAGRAGFLQGRDRGR